MNEVMARLLATNTKYQSWKLVPAKFKTICVPNKILLLG